MKSRFITKYLSLFIALVGYVFLYYVIDRSEFVLLFSGILILGAIYLYWLKISIFTAKEIIVVAIIFRVSFLFDIPNFSDDCYRFVWDGNVTVSGGNPYLQTPEQILDTKVNFGDGNMQELYKKLNSKSYFTVYPPLNQAFFAVSAYLGNGNLTASIIYLKLFILLFEIGLIFLLFRMLRKLKMKESLAQIYALNPLVIIELVGNVHFEGVMLFFFLLGLFFLLNNKIWMASVGIGLAISVKLIPLIFLPLLLPLLGFKRSVKLYLGLGITFILLLIPFISQSLIDNFGQSLGLYFQSFEFNASFYYLFKGISYSILGYKSEIIGIISPILIFSFAIFLTWQIFKRNNRKIPVEFDILSFTKYGTILLFTFYLLASTIHPWYVINVLILSVFWRNRAIIIWSVVIFVSYFAYSTHVMSYSPSADFHQEPLYYCFVGLQYTIVLFFFIFDQRKKQPK